MTATPTIATTKNVTTTPKATTNPNAPDTGYGQPANNRLVLVAAITGLALTLAGGLLLKRRTRQ